MKTRHLIQKLYGGFAWMAVLVMAGYSIAQAAPTIYGVYSYDGLTAGVQFSVPVDPTTATAVANYAVSGTTVTNVTLMPDGASVALGLSVPISGQFVVTVNNVEDTSLNPIAPNSTATNNVLNLVITPFGDADPANGGQPYSATYTGGYATLIAGGSDLYGNGDNFVFENMPVTNDFDYCMKIPLVGPDGQPFDRSGLMVRDLTNDMYAHEILVSHNAGPNAGNSAADSAQVTLRFALDYTASTTYSEPPNPLPAFYGSNSWVRLQRSGNIFTCYYASNGVHWLRLYQFDGSSNRTPDGITGAAVDGMFTNAVLYLGMATCAHNSAVDTTNIVSDLGPTPLAPVRIYTQPPATMIFRQNVPAQISVGAGGVPDPVYQWLTNGVPIPGATNATYNVASPQPSDAGTYSVLVSNYFSSVLSSNCVVTYSADTTPPTAGAGAALFALGEEGEGFLVSGVCIAFADSAGGVALRASG